MELKKSPDKDKPNPEILVFISSRESVCDECHENLSEKAWITLNSPTCMIRFLVLSSILEPSVAGFLTKMKLIQTFILFLLLPSRGNDCNNP